ncbi:hypothetical protein L083_7605 [Actinoplanes sp. N902-109]|nr:hypothetical protein L083_7605 [Actinoplanes sp. N902-109]
MTGARSGEKGAAGHASTGFGAGIITGYERFYLHVSQFPWTERSWRPLR